MMDRYTCPNGKVLKPKNRNFVIPRSHTGATVNANDFIRYRANKRASKRHYQANTIVTCAP